MKKFSIIIAAVALMTMTACNEKPAKDSADKENAAATEQVETKDDANAPKIAPMEKAAPTEDGKDHVVSEFNTKDYQVTVENLADGTYRVRLSKDGKVDKEYLSKNCRIQGKNYVMETVDGCKMIIGSDKGQILIIKDKEIVYNSLGK